MTPIDEYISTFPKEIQTTLQAIRTCIKKVVPEAEECINYGIPTFKHYGNLVHFAGYKNHIGFYPGAEGIFAFKDELAGYKSAKGSVQFPINKPIPYELIGEITLFRKIQNEELAESKKKKK